MSPVYIYIYIFIFQLHLLFSLLPCLWWIKIINIWVVGPRSSTTNSFTHFTILPLIYRGQKLKKSPKFCLDLWPQSSVYLSLPLVLKRGNISDLKHASKDSSKYWLGNFAPLKLPKTPLIFTRGVKKCKLWPVVRRASKKGVLCPFRRVLIKQTSVACVRVGQKFTPTNLVVVCDYHLW